MNVIFHRNCLDGAFASFCAFLASKLIQYKVLGAFHGEQKVPRVL